MSEVNIDIIEQAIYGSYSGWDSYMILAASVGLCSNDLSIFSNYSNLGGSSQLREDPGDIYSFYPIDASETRWGFSRTTFLGMNQRGNDYLTHILVLPVVLLDKIGWDIFLLTPLFQKEKPIREQVSLPVLSVPILKPRPCMDAMDPRVFPDLLPHVANALQQLSEQGVAFEVDSEQSGIALCQSVYSALPVDDRRRTSFCSFFSYPHRGQQFNLVCYSHVDRMSAQDLGLALRLLSDRSQDEFQRWIELIISGSEALRGISLLRDSINTVQLVKLLYRWAIESEQIQKGRSVGNNILYEAKQLNLNEELIRLARDPYNRQLPTIVNTYRLSIIAEFAGAICSALILPKPLPAINAACENLRKNLPDEDLRERSTEYFVQIALTQHAQEREALTIGILLALRVPQYPQLDLIYNIERSNAVLCTPQAAAQWAAELYAQNSLVYIDILEYWFKKWAQKMPKECLKQAGEIAEQLAHLSSDAAINAGQSLITALENAGPTGARKKDRKKWFFTLVRDIRERPGVRAFFSPAHAARLVLQESLLEKLETKHYEELTVHWLTLFPKLMLKIFEPGKPILAHPQFFLSFLQEILRSLQSEFNDPDIIAQPEVWELGSHVTLRAAEYAMNTPKSFLVEAVTAVLLEASYQIHESAAVNMPSQKRFWKALESILKVSDNQWSPIARFDLIRTLYMVRCIGHASPLMFTSPERLLSFIERLSRDIRDDESVYKYKHALVRLKDWITVLVDDLAGSQGVRTHGGFDAKSNLQYL